MKFKFLFLLLCSLVFAKEIEVNLANLYPSKTMLRGAYDSAVVNIPIANRWKIDKFMLHLEFMPSKALNPQRSLIRVVFNGVVVFQKRVNPNIDIYSYDISIPKFLIRDFNKLQINAIQHYCLDCCENPSSSELWTQIFWKKSYIKLNYKEKPIKDSLVYLRDYILDYKNIGVLHFGILTQNRDDLYLTMGAKIASYLGSNIKYRKIYVDSVENLKKDEDIFLIGNINFVKKLLKIKGDIPNVFLMQNPFYPKRAIVVITADNNQDLQKMVDSLISIPRDLIIGKSLSITKYKKPTIKAYESPKYIPFEKRVYLKDLGYGDFKFYNPSSTYSFSFNVPPDIFTFSPSKWKFHMFYSYNGAVDTKASAINLFLNGKFIGNLKVDKKYGAILEDKEIEIPVYLLIPGKNTLTVQFALKAPGGRKCVSPNYKLLQGTLFSNKSYIKVPELLHWREMPYLELFTTEIYPFSIYPDLKDTQIFITSKTPKLISALYTLMAYTGEKTLVPSYNVSVVSRMENLDRSKNIIALGSLFPNSFYKNTAIEIDGDNLKLKYNAFKKIEDTIKNRLLGEKENKDLKIILKMKDKLTGEVLFVEGKSPFKDQRTVMMVISKSDENILKSIQNLYNPEFAGKIKGDIAVVNLSNKKVYSASLAPKYYVGHLPLLNYILFRLGFSLPMLLVVFSISVMLLIIILKILLDIRQKKVLK